MSAKIIKKSIVIIQTKKNFRMLCERAYLYILKENDKSFVILFKSGAYISDSDIQTYRKEKNSNIIIYKKINSRVVATKISTFRKKFVSYPPNFIFSLKFGISSKITVFVESMLELNQWVSQINMLADTVKPTMFLFRSIKLFFLRAFRKTKPLISSGINEGTNVKKLATKLKKTEMYYVYNIVSQPPREIFNNLDYALVELDSKELKLIIKNVECKPFTLKWEYSQIKRYGVSDNIFSFDVIETIFTDTHEKKIINVSYFLALYQQDYMKQTFEQYYIKTLIKPVSFEMEKFRNPLIEYQSRFQTVKSDLIFQKIIDIPGYGDQKIQLIDPIALDKDFKETNGSEDFSRSIPATSNQKMCNSIIVNRPETPERFSTQMKNCPTSTMLYSDVIQTVNNDSQESSKGYTPTQLSLKSLLSSLPISKSIKTCPKSPEKTKISDKYDCIHDNECKIISRIYRNPQIIPIVPIDSSTLSNLNHSA